MVNRVQFYFTTALLSGLLILLLSGCKPSTPPGTQPPLTPLPSPATPSVEPVPAASLTPSPTALPLAARVGQIEISLAEYEAELEMYRAAKGTDLAPEDEEKVLGDLVDQAILASAAADKGFSVDEALLEQRIQQLSDQLGSEQALENWYSNFKFDLPTFQQALRRSIAAAWMRDQIAGDVPKTAEQVHARQILLYNVDQATEVYQQLQAGNSFRNLALDYDPITGGDLGWFPKGYLPHKQIEEAAFSLELEGYSPVIETPAGFHIIQVLERETDRPLSADALLVLQTQAVIQWLEKNRQAAPIEVLLP